MEPGVTADTDNAKQPSDQLEKLTKVRIDKVLLSCSCHRSRRLC